ncbi:MULTISPECIES: GAF domain-containing protein [unclassified Streptomyces]|uniref:GAF domain-containing protein n=1 Tax=unclassified Streptomyces TaxID=2593676 RepID=UPI002DDBDC85|nr:MULTISPECIES: GAF domain-containing protein [unclassified Streptomyces]WSA91058.1 GAF domain-containing protein [Streptomyces sp. NBC_01795]WSB75383.1 GAF domain-containing protein [Streptomyces sp. NBC_01775]WSS45152.1 GAF domain-containing protein [Streptomyces sp. NBC_01187]
MPPTSYDPTSHLLLTPEDAEAPRRVVRLRELGLGEAPVPEFDEFARELANVTGAPYAMVNFIDEHRQYFAGLYTPAAGTAVGPAPSGAPGTAPRPCRVMARDHGYCPHVVVRRKALVLEDVCDYPRFAGNPVVDEIGIRSYLGAPLIDRTGMTLGTVCVVAQEPRPWGRQGLETIKSMAAELVERIHRLEAGTG